MWIAGGVRNLRMPEKLQKLETLNLWEGKVSRCGLKFVGDIYQDSTEPSFTFGCSRRCMLIFSILDKY